jgi:CheY-like chemotaxis protein
LVEDTLANQKLVRAILTRHEHEVDIAFNGAEAVEKVGQRDYDVVLMDVQMPVMDGFQATAAIRRLPPPKCQVPIVAMTAHAMRGDEERCLAAGMNVYMPKPIDAANLLSLVESISAGPSSAVHRLAAAPTGNGGVFDLQATLSRLGGDRELFYEFVQTFASEADEQIEQLRHAVAQRKAADLTRIAHNLKGLSSGFSADRAVRACQAVEARAKSGDLESLPPLVQTVETEVAVLRDALTTAVRAPLTP